MRLRRVARRHLRVIFRRQHKMSLEAFQQKTTEPLPVQEEKKELSKSEQMQFWVNLTDLFTVIPIEALGEFGNKILKSQHDLGGKGMVDIATTFGMLCQDAGIRTIIGSDQEATEQVEQPQEKTLPYFTISELLANPKEYEKAYVRVPALVISLTEALKRDGNPIESPPDAERYYKLWKYSLEDCFNLGTLTTLNFWSSNPDFIPPTYQKGKYYLFSKLTVDFNKWDDVWEFKNSKTLKTREFETLKELQSWHPANSESKEQ